MSFLALFEIIKKFITPKRLLYVAIALVVAFLTWKVYDAGIKHEAVKTAAWEKKAKDAQALNATNQKNYATWSKQQSDTNAAAIKAQRAIAAEVTAKNQALQAQLTASRGVVHEVTKYVTVEADKRCVVPRGFAFLYNHSLGDSSADFSIAGSHTADEPSGLELSEVARVIGINNIQAQSFRNQVILWQLWYRKNKAFFDSHPNLPVPVPAD